MPIINGLKIPLGRYSTVRDVIENLFDLRCEFLVSKNSKSVPINKYETCKVRENDILQVITYSKECYRIHKRIIFKSNADGEI